MGRTVPVMHTISFLYIQFRIFKFLTCFCALENEFLNSIMYFNSKFHNYVGSCDIFCCTINDNIFLKTLEWIRVFDHLKEIIRSNKSRVFFVNKFKIQQENKRSSQFFCLVFIRIEKLYKFNLKVFVLPVEPKSISNWNSRDI